jgi:hypothetical protein
MSVILGPDPAWRESEIKDPCILTSAISMKGGDPGEGFHLEGWAVGHLPPLAVRPRCWGRIVWSQLLIQTVILSCSIALEY